MGRYLPWVESGHRSDVYPRDELKIGGAQDYFQTEQSSLAIPLGE